MLGFMGLAAVAPHFSLNYKMRGRETIASKLVGHNQVLILVPLDSPRIPTQDV